MKKFSFLIILFLGLILVTNSCKKDKCKDVVCTNGNCVEGNCNCEYGWKGTFCDTKKLEAFLGFWEGELSCGAFFKDTTVIKIKEVENTLDSLKMNTIGFIINYSGFTISLDDYQLTGKINEDFNAFAIGPNHIVFEQFGQQIDADITGKGKLSEEKDSLNLEIDISTFISKTSCSGKFKK